MSEWGWEAGLLLPGEPGGVGSGQAAGRPGARAEPSGQAQAGVHVQSLKVSWGATLWGGQATGVWGGGTGRRDQGAVVDSCLYLVVG